MFYLLVHNLERTQVFKYSSALLELTREISSSFWVLFLSYLFITPYTYHSTSDTLENSSNKISFHCKKSCNLNGSINKSKTIKIVILLSLFSNSKPNSRLAIFSSSILISTNIWKLEVETKFSKLYAYFEFSSYTLRIKLA